MTPPGTELFSFGALLKAFRTRRRLTQQQLAEAIGMHRSAIVRWEQGDFLPESKTLVLELARRLHLDDQETRHLLEASLTALAPHWSVPLLRNPFFTGREEILKALHAQLGADQAVALTQSSALHGLGGVGKTQIALEYAYRHALEYSAVFWIGAETIEQVLSSLLRIADTLQLCERHEADQQRMVTAVQRWLGTHSGWLLIWDNLDELDLLPCFLPAARHGAILLTTRNPAVGTLARGIDLLPMEQGEGLLFLLRRAKVLEPAATREHIQQFALRSPTDFRASVELVTIMDGLPLALDQAGAYLEETGCSLADYWQRYQQQRAHLLARRGGAGGNHPQSVTTTFRLSSERVEREQKEAADLLRVCALLHAEAIPEQLFITGAPYLGPDLESLATDPTRFDQAIAVLRRLSLVQRQAATHTISLHRLVQAVLRENMPEQEHAMWLQRVIAALNRAFPEVLPSSEDACWQQGERLLPHTLLCLQQAEPNEDSLTLACLAHKAALYLGERGRYAQAEPLFQRALRIREQVLGPTHPEVATSLHNLAVLYWEQGEYAKAEPHYRRALHIREQALGTNHPEVASTLNDLALLYLDQGRYPEAEPLFQHALRIWEQAPGLTHPLLAEPLHNLAVLYWRQGRYPEAESLFHRASCIWEQALGPDHLQVTYPLHGLALLYLDQGRYPEAEPLFQHALQIREQALGPEHPYVAYPLQGLAELYAAQGKDVQAELFYRRALHIQEQALGPEHPYVAYPLQGLAELYAAQGKDVQAEPLFQHALQIREQALGPEHPRVAVSLNSLANLLRERNDYAHAEALYHKALAIREQHLGQHHPETAQTLHDLAIFKQKQGNLGEAFSLVERALSIRSQYLGDAHPKTVASRTLCVQIGQEQARAQEETASERSGAELPDSHKEERQAQRASPTLREADHPSPSEDDPVQEFLMACCELHPLAWCRIRELWHAYEHWTATAQRCVPLSRRAFAAQLKARGCCVDRTRTARIWRGIRLVKTSS